MVQLKQGADEFRWNLHESGKFIVDSVQLEVPVGNKKSWKMMIPLKKKIHGVFAEE
jgi:hypothetical protein